MTERRVGMGRDGDSADPVNQGVVLKTVPRTRLPILGRSKCTAAKASGKSSRTRNVGWTPRPSGSSGQVRTDGASILRVNDCLPLA